ncbi:beta-phosphoglucomutase [Scandinavium goeteborgense]|nr:beta-phosphoglucomutase [Scandinavium goeteborgense]QKN82134.1 beta-phosphoglucomutase [Scandinavium goeteborgense]
MKLDAVIFDLDGVVTDTAHLHYVAWRDVAKEIGISIDETFNEQLKGISRMASLQRILQHGGKAAYFSPADCEELCARKNNRYVATLASLTPESILPGITALLQALRGRGIRIGLASVSLNAPVILNALGISHLFDYCADASRIVHSKPDPEIFLLACRGLGVAARHAIGIEDSLAGIQAINASGMASVGIGEDLMGAGLLLPSTRELNWHRLDAYWQRLHPAPAPVKE